MSNYSTKTLNELKQSIQNGDVKAPEVICDMLATIITKKKPRRKYNKVLGEDGKPIPRRTSKKTPEETREYYRAYYEKNRQRICDYYHENRDVNLKNAKTYYRLRKILESTPAEALTREEGH